MIEPPKPSNDFIGMQPFSWQHILLMLGFILLFVLVALLMKKLGKKAQKITLIVMWSALVLNYVLFFAINAFGKDFIALIRYNPLSWVQKYVFQYMAFLPLIFLGIAVFKKKDKGHFSKTACFFLLITWGVACLFTQGTSTYLDYSYKMPFGGNGGLMMGILYDEIFVDYIINNVLYIAIPVYLAVFEFYKPSLRDVPRALIAFVGVLVIANVYNDIMVTAHNNLNLFYIPNGLGVFHSNVLYTKFADGIPFLAFLSKIGGNVAFWYLLWLLPLFLVVFIIYTLPFYKKEDYKNFKHNFKQYFLDLNSYWKTVFSRPVNQEELDNLKDIAQKSEEEPSTIIITDDTKNSL